MDPSENGVKFGQRNHVWPIARAPIRVRMRFKEQTIHPYRRSSPRQRLDHRSIPARRSPHPTRLLN